MVLRPHRFALVGLALCVGALLAGPTLAAAEDPLLPDCGRVFYGGKVQPGEWSSACLGGSVNLGSLRWGGWGAPTEVATGVVHYNTCDPSCADGDIYDYPAQLQVTNIQRCASPIGPALYYTTFTTVITFPEDNAADRPAGPSAPFTFSSGCPNPGYVVSVNKRRAKFGAFEEGGEYDGSRLETLFGPPATQKRRGYTCTKRWPSLGMRVELVRYDDAEPCDSGGFLMATLTSSRWHTSSGVYPGGPASRARKAARRRRCTKQSCNRRRGYVLALHRSECAPGRYPGVIAETRGRKVRRIVVLTYSCE